MLHILCVIVVVVVVIIIIIIIISSSSSSILAFFSVSPGFVSKIVYTSCLECLCYWHPCALFNRFSFREFLTVDCPKMYMIFC
jgi:hypothetical protein